MRIYLAGPEVFHAEAAAIGEAKAALCARYGHEGLFPLDAAVSAEGLTAYQHGLAIYAADIDMMDQADAIIANLTPFRGPHADPGTAFELGYMRAQGKTCLAYSTVPALLADRLGTGERDADGFAIERFDMADNLMLEGAVADGADATIERPKAPTESDPYWDFRAFEACLRQL